MGADVHLQALQLYGDPVTVERWRHGWVHHRQFSKLSKLRKSQTGHDSFSSLHCLWRYRPPYTDPDLCIPIPSSFSYRSLSGNASDSPLSTIGMSSPHISRMARTTSLLGKLNTHAVLVGSDPSMLLIGDVPLLRLSSLFQLSIVREDPSQVTPVVYTRVLPIP
jgi:hypothetical protein